MDGFCDTLDLHNITSYDEMDLSDETVAEILLEKNCDESKEME